MEMVEDGIAEISAVNNEIKVVFRRTFSTLATFREKIDNYGLPKNWLAGSI